MLLSMEYTFHASHWNEEFFDVKAVHELDGFELLKNQHGHLWTVRIEVEGSPKDGIVFDYNKVQALIKSLDFTFLPLHPLTMSYLASVEGVSEDELMRRHVWGTCGKLEVLLRALVRRLAEMIFRPGVDCMRVTLYETGPDAHRNVKSLSATQVVEYGEDGELIWD